MSVLIKQRRFILTDLKWLIPNPTSQPNSGLTAFRQAYGKGDLFSVYLRFSMSDGCSGAWDKAKIYALVEEMEERLPNPGEKLVITAGGTLIAEAKVISDGVELI